jgi:hypothetical protein
MPSLKGLVFAGCVEVVLRQLFIESSGTDFSTDAGCKTFTLEACKTAAGKLLVFGK